MAGDFLQTSEMSLQLFLVPPKQLDEWDDDFQKEFSKWKCRESNSNSNKGDYRQYIINLNSEFNLDKIYDNLEIGLEAFKKLRELITRFPQYKLNDNLEKLYSDSENVKDFITWGAEFVGSLDSDTVDLAIDSTLRGGFSVSTGIHLILNLMLPA